MRYIVAVSGGVDSVVLLDMLVKGFIFEDQSLELIVAHFEHGIRGEDSKSDAKFVELLSKNYGLKYEIGYGNLSQNSSEAEAREKRYEFLKRLAERYDGKIITAHHQDDLIETIAINIARGTGWRGLAVMGREAIIRPLLGKTKSELYEYALTNNLEWVEDETNHTDVYLRNRLRRRLSKSISKASIEQLVDLWQAQKTLKTEINEEVSTLSTTLLHSRYFLTMLDEEVAIEILRRLTNEKLVRPQLRSVLLAVKTMKPNGIFEAGAGVTLYFSKREFIIRFPE